MGDATAGDDGSDDDGGEDNGAAAGEGQQSSNDSAPDSDSGTPGTDVGLGGAFTDATGGEDDDPPPQFGTPDGMLGIAPGRDGDTNPYTDNIEPPLDDGIYAMPPYFDLSPEEKAGPIPTTPLDIQPGPIPNPPGNPDPLLGYPPFYQDILLPGLPPPLPGPVPPFPTGIFVIGGAVLAGIVGITAGYWLGLNNPAVGNFYGIAPGNLGLPPTGPPSPYALLNQDYQDYLEGNAA
jgi:hypothetical protein